MPDALKMQTGWQRTDFRIGLQCYGVRKLAGDVFLVTEEVGFKGCEFLIMDADGFDVDILSLGRQFETHHGRR